MRFRDCYWLQKWEISAEWPLSWLLAIDARSSLPMTGITTSRADNGPHIAQCKDMSTRWADINQIWFSLLLQGRSEPLIWVAWCTPLHIATKNSPQKRRPCIQQVQTLAGVTPLFKPEVTLRCLLTTRLRTANVLCLHHMRFLFLKSHKRWQQFAFSPSFSPRRAPSPWLFPLI